MEWGAYGCTCSHVYGCLRLASGFPFAVLHSVCWGESLNLEFACLPSLAARSLGISSLTLPSGITGRLPDLPGFFLWVLGIQAPASFLAGKGLASRVTAPVLKEPLTSGHRLQYKCGSRNACFQSWFLRFKECLLFLLHKYLQLFSRLCHIAVYLLCLK